MPPCSHLKICGAVDKEKALGEKLKISLKAFCIKEKCS